MLASANKALCPCGSKLRYTSCCKMYHENIGAAPTAAALMRSRYCAYALKNYAYILATYGQSQQASLSVDALKESDSAETKWIHLDILYEDTNANTATVEFVAVSLSNGVFHRMHETSDFEIQETQWRYTTGQIWQDTGTLKLSRNDACPCNSGKKVKRCCLK